MNEYNKLCLICFARNVISLICFTILAIIFNKWWIVFFSLLFWCGVEKDKDEKENKSI